MEKRSKRAIHKLPGGSAGREDADGEPSDECVRDLDGQPMSDEQVLALARRIQEKTGWQTVLERQVGCSGGPSSRAEV